MLTYLIWGIGYGFTAAMQPGQFQAYLMAQTLRQGWRKTLPMIFAPLLSDGPVMFWFSVNWRIQSFELAYKNGGIHHAQTT